MTTGGGNRHPGSLANLAAGRARGHARGGRRSGWKHGPETIEKMRAAALAREAAKRETQRRGYLLPEDAPQPLVSE